MGAETPQSAKVCASRASKPDFFYVRLRTLNDWPGPTSEAADVFLGEMWTLENRTIKNALEMVLILQPQNLTRKISYTFTCFPNYNVQLWGDVIFWNLVLQWVVKLLQRYLITNDGLALFAGPLRLDFLHVQHRFFALCRCRVQTWNLSGTGEVWLSMFWKIMKFQITNERISTQSSESSGFIKQKYKLIMTLPQCCSKFFFKGDFPISNHVLRWPLSWR